MTTPSTSVFVYGAAVIAALISVVQPAIGAVQIVTPTTCPTLPSPNSGGFCGTIPVPFNRANPASGTLTVGFRLYAPPTPVIGTIVLRQGGPGAASTAANFVKRLRSVMAPLYSTGYAELFIDQRGRGLSSAINCPDLQANAPSPMTVISCAQSLVDGTLVPGSAAADYSSAAAADDLEDVRESLIASGQIPSGPITLFGQSYAGVDLEAYSARYPQNLRAMVGDAPFSSTVDFFNNRGPVFIISTTSRACSLNAGCAPNPTAVDALTSVLRYLPESGSGYDLTGALQTVTATETTLLLSVLGNAPQPGIAYAGEEFLNQGEAGAAAQSFFLGDKAPLFRLLAENLTALSGSSGSDGLPYTQQSEGETFATQCADLTNAPWAWGSSTAEASYQAALAAQPPFEFAPFSKTAWNTYLGLGLLGGDTCVPWPTAPVPVIPSGTQPTSVPVLALSGNLDQNVPTPYAAEWAQRYPNSIFVVLNGRPHIAAARGDLCDQGLIQAFIANPSAVLDESCAATPQILPLATPAFPVSVRFAIPAQVSIGHADRSRLQERQLGTVAIATVLDGLKRFVMGATSDRGLRGGGFAGVFNSDSDGTFTLTYSSAEFVTDVAVSGSATWDPVTFGLNGALSLTDAKGASLGSLTLSGTWRLPGQAPIQVLGTLNGRGVALLVPAT